MGERVCMTGAGHCGGAAGVDTCGYPVETTGNAVLDIVGAPLVHACLRAR